MLHPAGEPRPGLVRLILVWGSAAFLLAIAFIFTVMALNSTVYSASGYVTRYLQTLGNRDIEGALGIAGIEENFDADDAANALLSQAALGTIRNIDVVSTSQSQGLYQVHVSYEMAGANRVSTTATSVFVIEPAGSIFGMFNAWKFHELPLATLSVGVVNTDSVSVNNLSLSAEQLESSDRFEAKRSFPVLVPGLYVLSHSSTYLTSEPIGVPITKTAAQESGVVLAMPNGQMTAAVQAKLNSFLDDCAEQKVLYPAGCPFGKPIEDRIQGDVSWDIVAYPSVRISPDGSGWVLGGASGIINVKTSVVSLYDGSVSPLDEDMAFVVSYTLSIEPDGSIVFTPRPDEPPTTRLENE